MDREEPRHRVATFVRQLYERREASAVWGGLEHRALRRARKDMARVERGLRSDRLKLPTFLLGGAFLTGTLSAVLSGVLAATRDVSLLGRSRARHGRAARRPVLGVHLCCGGPAPDPAEHGLGVDCPLPGDRRGRQATRDHSYNLVIVAITFMLAGILVLPLATWLFLQRCRADPAAARRHSTDLDVIHVLRT